MATSALSSNCGLSRPIQSWRCERESSRYPDTSGPPPHPPPRGRRKKPPGLYQPDPPEKPQQKKTPTTNPLIRITLLLFFNLLKLHFSPAGSRPTPERPG